MTHLARSRRVFAVAGLLLALLSGCSQAPTPPELTDLAAPVVQDAQGLVVLRATAFGAHWPRGQHAWQAQPNTAAVGGTDMVALPDVNGGFSSGVELRSPRLDYQVQFVRAGTHYVWVRGQAAAQNLPNGDSLHLGLNQLVAKGAQAVTGFGSSYRWANRTMGGSVATLQIPAPGLYTLNVWMREDGMRFDGLAVSSSPRFLPTATTLSAAPIASAPAPTPIPAPTPTPVPVPAPDLSIGPVSARAADAFVDSVGVNTHLHYTDTVYNRFSDLVKPKLLASGIRHIRDGAYTYAGANRDSFYYARLRELAAGGVRFNLLTNMQTSYSSVTDFALLDDIYSWTNGAVESFEGVNETDIQGGTYNWPGQATEVQQKLYSTVRNNPALGQVKVIGPSPVWDAAPLGNLSSVMDYGNAHAYSGGQMPLVSGYGGLQFNLDKAAINSGTDPVIVTEVGYHTALKTTNGHLPVSESVAAIYTPRLLLGYFNRGVIRTYLYQFIDHESDASLSDPEAAFGLLRNDGSEKPVFVAVKTLLNLLKDPGTPLTPGALRYELLGNTANVQQTLLQKRDGTFYLALWVEAPSWDRNARRELVVPGQAVSLKLGDPVGAATRYTFGPTGQAAVSALSPQAGGLELVIDDKLTLIELKSAR